MLPKKLSGIKSEADTTVAVSDPSQQPQMRWGCPLCYVGTSSEQFLNHIRGKKHKAMVASFILHKNLAKKAFPADGSKEVDEQENKIANDKPAVAQQYRRAMIEGLGQENSVPVEEFNSHAMIEGSGKEDKLVTVEKSGKDESDTIEGSRMEDRTAALGDPGKANSQVSTEGCRKEDIPVTVEEPGKDECPTIQGFGMKDNPTAIEESGKDNSHVSTDGCGKEDILVIDEEPGKNESPTSIEGFGIEDNLAVVEESGKDKSHLTIDSCRKEGKPVLIEEPGKNESPNTIKDFGMTDKPAGIEESGKDNSHATIAGCGKEDKPATVEEPGKEGSPVTAEGSGKEDKPVTVQESGIDKTPVTKDKPVMVGESRKACRPVTLASFPGPSIITGHLPFMPVRASFISQTKVAGKPLPEEGTSPITIEGSGNTCFDSFGKWQNKLVMFNKFGKSCTPAMAAKRMHCQQTDQRKKHKSMEASFISHTKVVGKPLPADESKEAAKTLFTSAQIYKPNNLDVDKPITADEENKLANVKPVTVQQSGKCNSHVALEESEKENTVIVEESGKDDSRVTIEDSLEEEKLVRVQESRKDEYPTIVEGSGMENKLVTNEKSGQVNSPITIEGSGKHVTDEKSGQDNSFITIEGSGKQVSLVIAEESSKDESHVTVKVSEKKDNDMTVMESGRVKTPDTLCTTEGVTGLPPFMPVVASIISQTKIASKPLPAGGSKEVGKLLFPEFLLQQQKQSFTCDVCKLICCNQFTLNAHLNGKKHKAQINKLNKIHHDKLIAAEGDQPSNCKPATSHYSEKGTITVTKEEFGKNCFANVEEYGKDITYVVSEGSGWEGKLVMIEESGQACTSARHCQQTDVTDQMKKHKGMEISFSSQTKVADKPLPADGSKEVDKRSKEADKPLFTKVPLKRQNQAVICDVCNLICYSQPMLNSHLNGKKHKAQINKLKLAQDDKLITTEEGNQPSNCKPATSHYSEKDISPVTDQDTVKKCFVKVEYGKDMTSVTAEGSGREDKLMIEESGKACTSAMSAKRRHCEQTDNTDQRKKQKALEASFISPKKVADKPLLEEGLFTKLPLKQQKQSFDCDICKIKCCNQSVLNCHLNGKKHKARINGKNQTTAAKESVQETNKQDLDNQGNTVVVTVAETTLGL